MCSDRMNSVTSLQRSYPNINILWSEIIAEELARSGVRHAVISPGSRSTPLVFALAAHPDITDHSVIDERSAAFYALGIARRTQQPVVLLCTSGTAAANYFPAVCEAHAAQVPLLLLTADRPLHLRHSGAAQTMDQVKLFGDHVRLFYESPQPEGDEEKLRALRADICHAVAMAREPQAGPVHVNLPFRKPLEPIDALREHDTVSQKLIDDAGAGFTGRSDGHAWTRYAGGEEGIDIAAAALLGARRPLIIAGPDSSGKEYAQALAVIAEHCGAAVMAEAASQLRYSGSGPVIATSDLLLRSESFRAFLQPDCILLLGAAPTNTQMQRVLASTDAVHVITVSTDRRRRDPAHRVSCQLFGVVPSLLQQIARRVRRGVAHADPAWKKTLARIDGEIRETVSRRLLAEELRGFEGAAVHALGQAMPEGAALIVSNSMPIRDVESFLPEARNRFDVYFNRGVNGIDGMVSTALGVARTHGGRCVLLTGDIAWLHNLTATFGEGLNTLPLTVILLNNNGGQIFDMLPVREFGPVYEKHFRTAQTVDIPALTAAMGMRYHGTETPEECSRALTGSWDADGVQLIEVRSDMKESGRIRRELLREITRDVDRLMGENESAPVSTTGAAYPLHWRVLAEGDGDPVILLHGFTRSMASWERLIPEFHGRTVIGVDLMGHGGSPMPEAAELYSLDEAAARIEDILDILGSTRVHLVGYSMGGRTALACALRFQQRLASLALLSAYPGIEDAAEREARRNADEKLAEDIQRDGLEAFVQAWSGGAMFAALKEMNPDAWQEAQRDRLRSRAHGLAQSLRGCGQGVQPSYWDDLPSLGVPSLIAAGSRDERYAAALPRMGALPARAETLLLKDAGHDLLFERPQEIAAALRALWKRA